MFSTKSPKAASTLAPKRRRMVGAMTGLAVAAALTATAIPAGAQSHGSHGASSQSSPASQPSNRHPLSPRQVMAAYYASYNGDLAAGFDRYISKNLVLHGFNGPEKREDWIKGDLNIKQGLTGFRLDVLDQIVQGNKVVTRWILGGTHTGTIFGIPASGRVVRLSGISIDRVVGGQSVEHWSEGNFGRFLAELRGETPPVQVTPAAQ
ncbi:ester cyclase [Planotetraspora sp. A-T 1434]|uniref:ester cyclase n=1 Tax=Planotetraspora sp. A-T 1434 TaxID=2979219 RepID=UPI0021C0BA36|nr:ester cyclase [Planotetraspora sp. A-T 1434]MCT9935036.1 ester cyclase [Planotetraspora sp. A-T 1434]